MASDGRRMEPGVPVAWLSLDGWDSDPARFQAYTIAALQTLPLGEAALATCSSFPWTTSGIGTAITVSWPIYSGSDYFSNGPSA